MEPVDALTIMGGVAPMRDLVQATSRRAVRRSIASGLIQRAGRRLVLASIDEQHLAAVAMTGTLSHLSAAQHWGWAVKQPPGKAWVTVGRHRKLDPAARRSHHISYADLADEVVDGVTTPLRTVLDCARRLPFDEALAVADSALRSRLVDADDLLARARGLRGPGGANVRRVTEAATPLAANPFESVLRAIVLEFPQLSVTPQVEIRTRSLIVHPDLVDRRHRIVLEADSFEFHTSKPAHDLDCERFTALGLAGWLVLRFSWEQVMLRPHYVREVLAELTAQLGRGRLDGQMRS